MRFIDGPQQRYKNIAFSEFSFCRVYSSQIIYSQTFGIEINKFTVA